MQPQLNVDLNKYSTMRLGGQAKALIEINHKDEVAEAWRWAESSHLPALMIGGGSNIVWRDTGFEGLLIVNKITGRETLASNDRGATVKLGGGEIWDEAVAWTVEHGLAGVECLSLIPGSAGATPVQNVEAYGQQIADSLVELEAFDTQTKDFVIIKGDDCQFGYRSSRFKTVDHHRFMICSITLKLRRQYSQPPFHRGLQAYVDEQGITDYSPASLRQAVITIRSAKLPNPKEIANNGSFFTNPLVDKVVFERLQKDFPEILNYPTADPGIIKLSAMWLIEQSGFSAGYQDPETGMALWPKHALVIINQTAKSTADLLSFKQKITDAVNAKFGVTLEQEPELLP